METQQSMYNSSTEIEGGTSLRGGFEADTVVAVENQAPAADASGSGNKPKPTLGMHAITGNEKLLYYVLGAFCVGAWVILLGGVAAYQNNMWANAAERRHEWWSVWYLFILLAGYAAILVLDMIEKFRLVLVVAFLYSFVLLTTTIEMGLMTVDSYPNTNLASPGRAIAAGGVMCAMAEVLIIGLLTIAK